MSWLSVKAVRLGAAAMSFLKLEGMAEELFD